MSKIFKISIDSISRIDFAVKNKEKDSYISSNKTFVYNYKNKLVCKQQKK